MTPWFETLEDAVEYIIDQVPEYDKNLKRIAFEISLLSPSQIEDRKGIDTESETNPQLLEFIKKQFFKMNLPIHAA